MKTITLLLSVGFIFGCTPKDPNPCTITDVQVVGGSFLSPGSFHFSCKDGRSSATSQYVKPGDIVCLAVGRLGDYYRIDAIYCLGE